MTAVPKPGLSVQFGHAYATADLYADYLAHPHAGHPVLPLDQFEVFLSLLGWTPAVVGAGRSGWRVPDTPAFRAFMRAAAANPDPSNVTVVAIVFDGPDDEPPPLAS